MEKLKTSEIRCEITIIQCALPEMRKLLAHVADRSQTSGLVMFDVDELLVVARYRRQQRAPTGIVQKIGRRRQLIQRGSRKPAVESSHQSVNVGGRI